VLANKINKNVELLEGEGFKLTKIHYKDRSMFLASDVASNLSYADPNKLARYVRGKWSEDFTDGEVETVEGNDLKDLKSLLKQDLREQRPESGPANSENMVRSLTLLSEEAIITVCMLSRTDVARKFRMWFKKIISSVMRGETPVLPAEQPKSVDSPNQRKMNILREAASLTDDPEVRRRVANEMVNIVADQPTALIPSSLSFTPVSNERLPGTKAALKKSGVTTKYPVHYILSLPKVKALLNDPENGRSAKWVMGTKEVFYFGWTPKGQVRLVEAYKASVTQ
jgi:prophage antirepressor-like protein